ncbi:PGF-CTERM-anchored ABC transporter substrate-binding protein [Haloglomus litoreum]|uniref:PGF-CTERM-anchored ABC transporter substrate-binding protein n=1 Tax=Haloglomus litoreum TaxID=3034026 RepID=UPI0023E81826|nr:PGF-CTERM-anchored ABC transporter substrate-binding protein [Haloglomus sp. DT116]
MRTLTTLVVAALLVAVAPGGALAAPATGPAGAHAPPTNGAVASTAGAATTQADCSFPVSRVDATGTNVTVSEVPDRVVVLAPSAAQTMWELDVESKVVGLPTGPTTAYLEGSQNRTDVTNQDGTVNRERVVGLQPDLVLAPNIVPNETISQLRGAGLTVYKVGFGKSLDSITTKVSLFGRFTGACDRAATVNSEFNATMEEIRADAPAESPRVAYFFYNFTTGSGTFIHEAIETAGGDNIAANAGVEGFKPLNAEIVADRNPQWVVRPAGSPLPSGAPWDSTDAYRLDQTLTVNNNLISQPGPRVVQPMRNMSEAFQSTQQVSTGTPTGGETPTEATTDDGGDGSVEPANETPGAGTTDSGGQPGFGAVTALVAAVLGVLALVQRER